MYYEAILAYTHYLSFLFVISSLVAELYLFRKNLTRRDRKLLQRADAIYGLGAILVLLTGFIRVFYFGKGGDYYFQNYYFLTKLGLFTVVGILSIYPTIVFRKWSKLPATDEALKLPDKEFSRINYMLRAEVVLVFILPLLAALMARGLGYFG